MSDTVIVAIITAGSGLLSQLVAKLLETRSQRQVEDVGNVGQETPTDQRPSRAPRRSVGIWRMSSLVLLIIAAGLFGVSLLDKWKHPEPVRVARFAVKLG